MFKLNDKVICLENFGDKLIKNRTGIVVELKDSTYIGVEFSININGHSCTNHGKDGYCYYIPGNLLQKIENKFKIKDKVKCNVGICKDKTGYVRHIGKLNGRGSKESVWSDWKEKWTRKPTEILTYLDADILEKI